MPSLLVSDKDATALMLRMRTLINLEFKILLNFTDSDIEQQLCNYGFRSQYPELLEKAKQLATLATIPLPDTPEGVDSLLELLASDRFQSPMRMSAAGVSAFVIDQPSKRFWSVSTLDRLQKLDEISVNFIHTQPLSSEDVEDLAVHQRLFQVSVGQKIPMKPLSLEEFYWFAGTRFSHGQLLRGLSRFKQIRLTRWPEMCRQSEYRNYTRMAVQLMQHPMSVVGFIQEQGAAKVEAISFLNACHLCGWLVESKNPLIKPQNEPSQKARLSFISRIRAKLGIG